MASRASFIEAQIESDITTAIAGITILNRPVAFSEIEKGDFPVALVLTSEDDPERLDFKQERRRVTASVTVGYQLEGATLETGIEWMRDALELIRDQVFADDELAGLVDATTPGAGDVYAGSSDPIVYGTLDIVTDEVF